MNIKLRTLIILFASISIALSACNSDDELKSYIEDQSTETVSSQVETDLSQVTEPETSTSTAAIISNQTISSAGQLDAAETTHLIFMREEEKLARDVYMTLYSMWPDAHIFENIGEGSEQTHTDVIRDKLSDYGITDPNPATNDLPSSIGIYTGKEYGAYFSDKYQLLINRGSQSELDALYVGAFIEELDMHDIVECPDVIVKTDNGISDCGLNYTDEPALITTFGSLLDGSKNHLRAFVGRIESIIGDGNYEAQVISQQDVNEILGR